MPLFESWRTRRLRPLVKNEEALSNTVKRRFTLRYSLLLFSLLCVLVSMLVGYFGLRQQLHSYASSTNQLSTTGYGVAEVEEAVEQIEVGVSTREDVNTLIGPYVESRVLYRLKDSGTDRKYFFVPRDRQIWMEFSTSDDGVVTVSKMGELEPKAKWIQRWEGGSLTFSSSESPY